MIAEKIATHLARDEKLNQILTQIEFSWPANTGDLYFDLIRSIVFQQLSGKAASTIHRRFLELFPDGYPHREDLQSIEFEDLRAVGLSRQKATYIQNVAEFFVTENLTEDYWADKSDEEIIEYLTQIKGVGKWTVQMILMFSLRRPDIFPVDDLGIQKGIIQLYNVKEDGKALKKRMLKIAEPWRPYRTYASWYLWRSLDL